MPVAAHATWDEAIRETVKAGVTSVEHGYEVSDETLRLMAERRVGLVATDPSLDMAMEMTLTWPVQPPEAEVREKREGFCSRLRRAHALGVPLALGSDFFAPYPQGRGVGVRQTLGGYLDAGLTPAQALQSATWSAGEPVDGGKIGVVEAGAWTDLVGMVEGPTLKLGALDQIELVMRRGLVAKASFDPCAAVTTSSGVQRRPSPVT